MKPTSALDTRDTAMATAGVYQGDNNDLEVRTITSPLTKAGKLVEGTQALDRPASNELVKDGLERGTRPST